MKNNPGPAPSEEPVGSAMRRIKFLEEKSTALPSVWIHWTEHPRKGAAKLYASSSGPNSKTNPNWKPVEYVPAQRLLEAEARIAKRDEYLERYRQQAAESISVMKNAHERIKVLEEALRTIIINAPDQSKPANFNKYAYIAQEALAAPALGAAGKVEHTGTHVYSPMVSAGEWNCPPGCPACEEGK